MNTYAECAQEAKRLHERQASIAAELSALVAAHGGPGRMGLTPDHVKAMPEWKRLRAEWQAAFEALRQHNGRMTKTFPREHAAAVRAERVAAR